MIIKAKIEASGTIANSDSKTIFIKVPVSKLQKDESDEVWWDNKLYDVAKRESVNDTEYVFLIRDEEEEDALAQNSDYFKNDTGILINSNCKLSPQKKSQALTDNNYVITSSKKILCCIYLLSSPTVKDKYLFTSACTDVPTPPPRKAS